MPKIHKKKYSDSLYIKARFKNQIITWQLTYEGEQLLKKFGLDKDKTEISRATAIAFRRANYLYTENSGLSDETVSPEIEPDGKNPITGNESELLKALRRVEVKRKLPPLQEKNTNKQIVMPETISPRGNETRSLSTLKLKPKKETIVNKDKRKHSVCPICRYSVDSEKLTGHIKGRHGLDCDASKICVKEVRVGPPSTMLCPICNSTVQSSRLAQHMIQTHAMNIDQTKKEGYAYYWGSSEPSKTKTIPASISTPDVDLKCPFGKFAKK